jgi:hypothetical protein
VLELSKTSLFETFLRAVQIAAVDGQDVRSLSRFLHDPVDAARQNILPSPFLVSSLAARSATSPTSAAPEQANISLGPALQQLLSPHIGYSFQQKPRLAS